MRFQRAALLSILFMGLLQGAAAQERDLFGMFGAVVRSGVAAAVQADWERIPDSEVACVDRALQQKRSSINDIIRRGISPSDGRIAGLRAACRGQAGNGGPSFDCRRASAPDERAICGNPELAQLDRAIADGYQFLRERFGETSARAFAGPLLAGRHGCGSDAGCIKSIQLSTIGEMKRRGAPIADVETASQPQTPFIVDGLRLGGRVAVGRSSYLEYSCNPSEQFAGFTWCQRRRSENSPRGPYVSTGTMLHAADGTALYINRFIEPAFFTGNEAMDDVRRLSARFGAPRFMTAPSVANAPGSLMAYWGDVVLEPLDRARLDDLAAGRDVHAGLLIDHLGNFRRSAMLGLPVYRLTGGAGYVWAASWDQAGRGTLRFLAVDASRISPPGAAPVDGGTADATAPAATSNAGAAAGSPVQSAQTEPPAPAPTGVPPSPAVTPPPSSVTPAQPAPNLPSPDKPAPAVTSPAAQPHGAPAGEGSPAAVSPPPKPDGHAETVQPRTVGPPLVNRTATADPNVVRSGNVLEWLLVGAVILLLAAVGYLLFDRRKRSAPPSATFAAPAMAAAEEAKATIEDVPAMSLADIKQDRPQEIEIEPVLMADAAAAPAAESVKPGVPPDHAIDAENTGPVAPTQGALQRVAAAPASAIAGHTHAGLYVLAGVVALAALLTPAIGLAGLVPLLLVIYLLPSIIAFKVRHHYAWALLAINIVFGVTGLAWLAMMVWSLTGPRKSALDEMARPLGLGLSQAAGGDPAVSMSDQQIRAGWKMPVTQAEIFAFADDGSAVDFSGDDIKVFFSNPVIGIWRTAPDSSGVHGVRYNVTTQVRCVTKLGAEAKLRVGRTLGRTALTGIGAALLTGRKAALGGAFLDYRFAGDETDEIVTALVVFSDYSSLVIQGDAGQFGKFSALLPAHVTSDEQAEKTAGEIDRIKRMADDGPRVLAEMTEAIDKTKQNVARLADQAQNGKTFSERDEGRLGLVRAESQLADEVAVQNAVRRLIELAAVKTSPDVRIA